MVTYDRRGNGRSPAPAGWKTTSPEEQADDAAGLLAALVRGPAVVCGTAFALCLLARHPAAVRGALLHEPALFAFLDDLDAVRAPLRARIRSAMETGGPEAATEPWWCYVAGEDAWNKLAPDLRERMRASSETLFGTELGTYERYLPDDETLAAVAPRVRLLVSADGLAPYTEAARRLGQRLGRDVDTTPGTPRGLPRPSDRVRAGIRRLLKELTAIRPYTAPAAVAYSDARDDQPSREGRALVAALPIRRKKRRCATETSVLRHNERRSECRSQTEAGTAFGYWRETS